MSGLIVFDLDGPILEGSHRHYACYSEILEQFGMKRLPYDVYWVAKRARIDLREILNRSDAGHDYGTFSRLWFERIESARMLAHDRVQPGVREILHACRKAMIRPVLVTARRDFRALITQLKKLELRDLFDDILIAPFSEGGKGKASVFYSKYKEAIPFVRAWIGDTEIDIIAARQLGVTAIALACGLRNRSLLESHLPDYVFNDIKEAFKNQPLSSLIRISAS